MKNHFSCTAVLGLIVILLTAGCGRAPEQKKEMTPELGIDANLVFYYYSDLDAAVEFYRDILGLKQVLDYGFARAFQIADSAFICLVDETGGMHDTSEPKSILLTLLTEELDGWYGYLQAQGIEMYRPLTDQDDHAFRNFMAVDPGGYILEFETFLEHEENARLNNRLAETTALYPSPENDSRRPPDLGMQGIVLWMYYRDLEAAKNFYQDNLGLELLVDQGTALVLSSSPTAFIGLVDEKSGTHDYTETKSVNVGFITSQVDAWYRHLLDKGLEMRGPVENAEEDRVRAFITYDVGNYFLEFDHFLDNESNRELNRTLGKQPED